MVGYVNLKPPNCYIEPEAAKDAWVYITSAAVTVTFSGKSTMNNFSLCEIFTPLLFMNDYVRQALTDRTAFPPEVRAQLSYFKYLVESYNEWKMDLAIEEWGNIALSLIHI